MRLTLARAAVIAMESTVPTKPSRPATENAATLAKATPLFHIALDSAPDRTGPHQRHECANEQQWRQRDEVGEMTNHAQRTTDTCGGVSGCARATLA